MKLSTLELNMLDIIENFAYSVTDMFEQMAKGNYTDSEGNQVKMNDKMISLIYPVKRAIELRKTLGDGF